MTRTADNRYLAPSEVAHMLNVSTSSIYRACEQGSLPHVQLRKGGALRIPITALEPSSHGGDEATARGGGRSAAFSAAPAARAGNKEER